MPDLKDGESLEVKGSGAAKYLIRNSGGVYSCTCPAWRNQSIRIEARSCKHIKKLRGVAEEEARVGAPVAPLPASRAEEVEAAPVLLAERWTGEEDITGWWMSEKLDGVRAYWDGRRFLSRLGNAFAVPEWFSEGLPEWALDGELFGGRKRFQRTVSVVRRQDRGEAWRELSFVIFDAPGHKGPFEERVAHCRRYLEEKRPPFARWHEHVRCEGLEHVRRDLSRIEGLGGEGLMLRQPGSLYVAGRSSTLLKIKSFFDAEARVVGHVAGEGRHKGRLGALLVEMPGGARFSVGSGFSDAERESPPPLGSVITYRYQELSEGGIPRFPTFVALRDDIPFPAAPAAPKPAPAPQAAPKPAPAAPVGGLRRRFELIEGSSRKFWEIEISGSQHTVRYGRLGAEGQAKTRSFADAALAAADAERLIGEKTKKGYAEV